MNEKRQWFTTLQELIDLLNTADKIVDLYCKHPEIEMCGDGYRVIFTFSEHLSVVVSISSDEKKIFWQSSYYGDYDWENYKCTPVGLNDAINAAIQTFCLMENGV